MRKLSARQLLNAVILDQEKLRSYPHVHSIAVGFKEKGDQLTGRPSVKVYVKRKVPKTSSEAKSLALVPRTWPILVPAGRNLYRKLRVSTDVVKVGRTRRAALAVGPGVRIGRDLWPPGSAGCIVQKDRRHFVLTAGHLFVDHDATGAPTDEIIVLQPPVPDEQAAFGTVEQVFYRDHEAYGHIDAALVLKRAKNRTYTLETGHEQCPRFLGVASPRMWLSQNVGKIAAQTQFRRGAFSAIHPNYDVGHHSAVDVLEYRVPSDAPADYKFAAEGDSGAMVFTLSPPGLVIGMLIGVSNDGRRGYVVPLQRMLDYFGVELVVP